MASLSIVLSLFINFIKLAQNTIVTSYTYHFLRRCQVRFSIRS